MFHACQTFFLDPNVVGGSGMAFIPAVDLYFANKPKDENNRSNIREPGVTLFLVPTVNGVPNLRNLNKAPTSRAEFNDIIPSADASIPTTFVFPDMPAFKTGVELAAVVMFDGNEDFIIWKSNPGGTVVRVDGPGDTSFRGNYYGYVSQPTGQDNLLSSDNGIASVSNTTSNVIGDIFASADYAESNWRSLPGVRMCITVKAARFRFSGSANLAANVDAITTDVIDRVKESWMYTVNATTRVSTWKMPAARYEFISFDRRYSAPFARSGEKAYQKQLYYPGGIATPYTVAVVNGSAIATTADFNFNSLISVGKNPEYLVFTSENHDGAGLHKTAVRKVTSVISNTQITLDANVSWSNAGAYVFKAPVGMIKSIEGLNAFGTKDDFLILKDSNANGSVRFVNNCIDSVTLGAAGSGYSNSDVITISGFEDVANKVKGGYAAKANVVTNGSGNVTGVYLSNVGAGFVNTAAMVTSVANSTGGASAGSGLTLTYAVGAVIRAEHSYTGPYGYFSNCVLVNMPVGQIAPDKIIQCPDGAYYQMFHRLPYYETPDAAVLAGKVVYCDSVEANVDFYPIQPEETSTQLYNKKRVIPSWSNELVVRYDTGTASNGYGVPSADVSSNTSGEFYSNASQIWIIGAAKNDFITANPVTGDVAVSKYAINNSYADENTNYGNAVSRGITKKMHLEDGHFAEDLKVFVNAYRPSGTDIKIFARVHNSGDSEAFDDKDWTLMSEDSVSVGRFSSQIDPNDIVELVYSIPASPNVALTFAGTVTTQASNSTITGVGTTWELDTANVVAGDLVRIYNPTNPNTALISQVATVTSNTVLVLNSAVPSNTLINGDGFIVQKLGFKQQAFLNQFNFNILRYYAGDGSEHDTFNTFQTKIVHISDDERIIPLVHDIQVAAVSA